MKDGLSLIVFPEGTRSRDGRVASFKGGSFYLALEAELPVVPISIVGSAPIDTTGLAGGDPRAARAFAARVREVIAPDAESDLAAFSAA